MRTLNRISYPNRVAAWTQAMDNNWWSLRRIRYPNNLEMRIQAYQAVANGATSLYWFTMGGAHMKNHRFNLPEIQRVNREIKLVGDLLTKTVPFSWVNTFMDIDINVLAGPDFAALFAIDLKYVVSSQNQFVSSGPSFETMEFNLPLYLHNADAAVKVSHDGLREIDVVVLDGKAYINDTIHTTGLYLLYNSSITNYGELMVERYADILEEEASYGFDPINNDEDWERLVLHIDITLGNIPRPTLSIQLNPENGGTVKGAGRYFPTARILLDAKAGSGYIFKGWTDVSGQPLHLEDGKFYMPDEDTTVIANFDSTVGGIADYPLSSTVIVYPNPGRGLFQLEYRSQNASSMEIEIFNSIGRKVYAKVFGHLTFVNETIDLRHLNNGIYYLRLKDNMGMHTVNIVLQK
jgi:hypothetical protein